MTYYVMTPFEPVAENEFLQRRDEFIRDGRKCIGIVINCNDTDDFNKKWFGDNAIIQT